MGAHQDWAETERQLELARRLLPLTLVEASAEGTLARYQEFLAANELALAMDELEGLGEQNASTAQFWGHLAEAARRMQLHGYAARYVERMAR